MADVRTPRDRTGTQRTRAGGRRVFMGETEARPGIVTSEFLLTVLAAATAVIAGYVSGALPVRLAWGIFGAIVVAYILSRGIAKAGSKEGPFIVRGDGTDR
jgi:hypothetical protein